MNEVTKKIIEVGKNRIHIRKREDGSFTYRHQTLEIDGWSKLGPVCGYYDTEKTAEYEARVKVRWLNLSGKDDA